MADSVHLEKMGRELKCPICLSLLNSTVSLSCNHMFCKSCIMKSMKSDSCCPVCKVPYRRREVRAAPHLDNLVSIYKSMEVASGLNIFVTQTASLTKVSDEQDQIEHDGNPARKEAGGTSHRKPKTHRISKRKGPKEPVEANAEVYDSDSLVKPFFPAKKRVQVTQCLKSETSMRDERGVGGDSSKHLVNGKNDGSTILKEKPSLNDMGELVFPPFFWLRDENDNAEDERLSGQQVEVDYVTNTLTPKLPSFSDIRDTSDESPTKTTNTGGLGVHLESKAADVYDSEMFEWTQRACSPELFSTPEKTKARYQELEGCEDQKYQTASENLAINNAEEVISEDVSCKQVNESIERNLLSLLKDRSTKAQKGGRKSKKTGRRTIGRAKGKRVNISADESIAPSLGKKNCNRKNKGSFHSIEVDIVAEDSPKESIEVKNQNQGNEDTTSKELPILPDKNPVNDQTILSNHVASETIKTRTYFLKNNLKSSKLKAMDAAVIDVLTKIPVNRNEENIQQPSLSCLKADARTSDFQWKKRHTGKKSKILARRHCAGESREWKRLKISNDDSEGRLVEESLGGSSKFATKETQNISQLQENLQIETMDNSKTTKKVPSLSKDTFMKKCESLPLQIQCAFCHTFTVSEASGEMLHYCNGKPVAADYNGGSTVIHSHSNCTEWAPNVYFDDEIIMNLETELARSRRIKCSCCGIKGAALGCYVKNCQKSFHIPCAKLVAQCRWDTDNFVMLCPLHSSSKLPNEILGSQSQRRKKSIPKAKPIEQQPELVAQHGASTSRQSTFLGSPNKWVLCCSGLTIAEKEIVSDFTRVTGVSVSKTFGPSVTHIIASTDQNGACKRTLKFLMGILEGKWILKIDWIKACMKAMESVAEEHYEVRVDLHGIKDGPRLGRLRVLNKQPKLFSGFKFYFIGEYMLSYKGDLQNLVVAAGGTVLHRKPITGDQGISTTYIIYNVELPDKCDPGKKIQICNQRRDLAKALAGSTGSRIAAHSWLLDSIAACKLQKLT